jgi:hypothetical protein
MSHARWFGFALTISVISSCHVAPKEVAGTSNVTAASSPNPSATAPAATQAERMPHCPNLVLGASTVVREVPDGVELRITAGSDGEGEIRRRAAFLTGAGEATRGKHRASGAVAAQFGRCPVVMRNTKLETREIPGGVALVVRPSSPLELEWVRREVEARAAQLDAPKAFGPGLMRSCPNGVPGAETIVRDAPYGADVVVTATTPEGMRAIRDRSNEVVRGTATEERCPVTSPLATLAVTDAPQGVSIAVKAKRPDDIASLRHTVRERVRNYEPPSLK